MGSAGRADLSVQHPRVPGRVGAASLEQGVCEETSMRLPALPLRSPMPLQCFPPLHSAKEWLEAPSFCTLGCWPEP